MQNFEYYWIGTNSIKLSSNRKSSNISSNIWSNRNWHKCWSNCWISGSAQLDEPINLYIMDCQPTDGRATCPPSCQYKGHYFERSVTDLHLLSTLHLAQKFDLYSICIHNSLAQYTRFFMHNLLSRIVIVNILLYSESTGSYYLVYSHRWTEYSIICFFKSNHKK